MRSLLIPVAILSSTLLMACEEAPKPPLKTAYSLAGDPQGIQPMNAWMMPGANGANGMNGAKADIATPTAGSIQIDDRILKACGDLPIARFAFDSAAITGSAADALGALAKCFVSGPLAGARLNLVGHADPRGGVAYNIALGQQRAGSVASFLAKQGLAEARMGTVSKGAFEATGMDEN